MKKRYISLLLAFTVIVSLSACSKEDIKETLSSIDIESVISETTETEETSTEEETSSEAEEETEASDSKAETEETSTQATKATESSKSAETTKPTETAKPTETPKSTTESQPTQAPHTHSYTSSITKQATCTSEGIKTYTCSCGASYTESIPKTSHSWVEQTQVVHHDQQGHNEQVIVGYDETLQYTCSDCGAVFNNYEDFDNHAFDNFHGGSIVKTIKTPIYETQWVVDSAAWDETVVTGYKCSVCGATK